MADYKRHITIHVTEEFAKQNGGMSEFIFPYDECDIKVQKLGDKWMFLVFEEDSKKPLLSIDVNAVTAINYSRYLNLNFCV